MELLRALAEDSHEWISFFCLPYGGLITLVHSCGDMKPPDSAMQDGIWSGFNLFQGCLAICLFAGSSRPSRMRSSAMQNELYEGALLLYHPNGYRAKLLVLLDVLC